jgi:hypothetical protein
MKDWIPPKSTPTPPTPPAPPLPAAPNADEVRARIAEMEGEADRLVMGMVRLWSKLSKLRKEV